MATIKTGLDHYIVASDAGEESNPVPYGDPCILIEEASGDLLFAHLDIPADDGSVRGAGGLDVAVYRLLMPSADQREDTGLDDPGPDGFDFEQEEDYISPFEDDEEYEDSDDTEDADAGEDAEQAETAEPKDS